MNIKTASNDFPIIDLLRDRWSPRAFDGLTIEKEKLQSLFEAARWSPSSSNSQPWRFIIGEKGTETYDRIFNILVEFNQLWAKTAPVLCLALAKNTNARGEHNNIALYDLGQAAACLTFQATSEGLFVHQMGGFNADEARNNFSVPDDYTVATVIAIGYIGDPEILHENLKKMEVTARERRKASDSVFTSIFGQTSNIFNQLKSKDEKF